MRINVGQRARTVYLARELCGDLAGRTVTVLGAAFKPDTDDIRDSPALDVAARLAAAGAHVTVTDPKAINNAWMRYPQLRFEVSTSRALEGAELVLLLTEWEEYRQLSPGRGRRPGPPEGHPGCPECSRRDRLGGGRLGCPGTGPAVHAPECRSPDRNAQLIVSFSISRNPCDVVSTLIELDDRGEASAPLIEKGSVIMGILGFLILGLIAGAIAKAILPGRQGGGWLITLVLGVVGAILGGWIGSLIFGGGLAEFFDLRTWLLAILGSIIVLLVYGMVAKRGSRV